MDTLTVRAAAENLEAVLGFIGGKLTDTDLAAAQRNCINIIAEEIFVNATCYAYPGGGGEVSVGLEIGADMVTLEFRDGGTPYNPLDNADPDTSLSAAEREIGGLGIFMVKNLADSVSYRYENNENILTVEKNTGKVT